MRFVAAAYAFVVSYRPMPAFENVLGAFERVERPPLVAYLRRREAAWLRAAGFLDPERVVPTGTLRRGHGVVIDSAGPVRCYVKHYFRGGLAARLLGDRYVGARRFVRELAAYEMLGARGVAVPRILALLLEVRRLFVRAWLVSECVEDTRGLGTALTASRPASRRRLLRATGVTVRRMHEAGVVHPDLTVENVRIAPDGTVALFDFDRCSMTSRSLRRWWNLFRLHRSAVKSGLYGGASRTRERNDVAAFLLGYHGERGVKSRLAGALFAAYRMGERAHALFWRSASDERR